MVKAGRIAPTGSSLQQHYHVYVFQNSDIFQKSDHPVHCGSAYGVIPGGHLVVDLLAGGSVAAKYNVQDQLSLLGYLETLLL